MQRSCAVVGRPSPRTLTVAYFNPEKRHCSTARDACGTSHPETRTVALLQERMPIRAGVSVARLQQHQCDGLSYSSWVRAGQENLEVAVGRSWAPPEHLTRQLHRMNPSYD